MRNELRFQVYNHKQIGDYLTRCVLRIAAAISLDDESSVTQFLEVMHSVPQGYACAPGDYAKILEVLLKFLEVMVLFQVVIQPLGKELLWQLKTLHKFSLDQIILSKVNDDVSKTLVIISNDINFK